MYSDAQKRRPETVSTVLIVGRGKNIYYIFETLYNLLGGGYFAKFHIREHQGPTPDNEYLSNVGGTRDLALPIVTSDDYIEKVSWGIDLSPPLLYQKPPQVLSAPGENVEVAIGHEAIDGWLNTWKRLIISKGVDGTRGLRAWEEIIASRRLRLWRIPIKQVLAPFELWVPVILRPELDFRLIENALDIAKPDVVVITSDAPYYNIRLFTQVRWAIKQRLSALGGDFSPENVPIVISNTVGPESETVRNLMTLQRAMPYTEKAVGAERGREPSWDKEWRLWEQDYPMAFPDAGADTYLSASEKTLGVLEAIRVWEDAKRSDEIPLGLNVCLHDVPGATCRLALGLAGMRPVFSRNAEYPLLSLQYTFAKSVSERTFTGSFLARLIRNPRNRNTYIELSDKPVIAAIYNFLEPLQGVDLSLSRKPHKKYVPHYLEDEDIKSQVRRVNGGRTLYVLRDVRKIFLTLNQDRELANDLPLKYDDTDSRLWKNYAELAKRGMRPGGRHGQFVVAGSSVRNIMAILNDTGEFAHAPGPQGLEGGYPVRLSRKGAEVVPPKGMTLAEARALMLEAQQYDGIQEIRDNGDVVVTDEAYLPKGMG